MRSESEIRWVRAKNPVGVQTKVSLWHAIVPGLGVDAPPPGTACGTGLTGSLQFDSHQGMLTLDGKRHQQCMDLAVAYIEDIDPSPGPGEPPDPDRPLAPPRTQYTETRERTV